MWGYGGKDASDLFLVYRARELNSRFLRTWGRRWSSQASVTPTHALIKGPCTKELGQVLLSTSLATAKAAQCPPAQLIPDTL